MSGPSSGVPLTLATHHHPAAVVWRVYGGLEHRALRHVFVPIQEFPSQHLMVVIVAQK